MGVFIVMGGESKGTKVIYIVGKEMWKARLHTFKDIQLDKYLMLF